MSSSGANTSGYLPPPTGSPLVLGTGPAATRALSNANLSVGAVLIPVGLTLAALGVDVTAAGDAGCTIVPCIYRDAGNGVPGGLLVAGTAVSGAATGQNTAPNNTVIPPGWYWVGALLLGAPVTPPTVRIGGPPSISPIGNIHSWGAAVSSAWNWQQSALAAPPDPMIPAVTTFGAPLVIAHT